MAKGFKGIHDGIAKARERAADNGLLPDVYWKDDRNEPRGDRHIQVIRFIPARNEAGEIDPEATTDTREFYEFLWGSDGEQHHFAKPEEGEDWIAANVKEMYKGKPKPPYAKWRTCALVALRQETRYVVDGKQVISYIDKPRAGVENGRPIIGVIRQAYENFWSHFEAFAKEFGTLTDRDYIVERWGNGRDDTVYKISPCEPIEGLITPEEVLAHYNPPVTLDDWLRNLESQERAQTLLGGGAPEVQPGFVPKTPPQQMQTQGYPGYGMPPQQQGYPQPQYGQPGYPQGYPQPGYPQQPQGYGAMPQNYGYPPQPQMWGQVPPQPQYGQPQRYQPPAQHAQQAAPQAQSPQGAPQGPPAGYGQPPAQFGNPGQPYGQPAPAQQPPVQQGPPQGYQPPAQPQQQYTPPPMPQNMPQMQQGFQAPPAQANPAAPPSQFVSAEFEALRKEVAGGNPPAADGGSLGDKILNYQSDV